MSALEFEINGQAYRAGKMSAMDQFNVARRLAPVLGSLAALVGVKAPDGSGVGLKSDLEAIGPISTAIAELPDEACNYVFTKSFAVVQRQSGGAWAPVAARGTTTLAYDDIELPQMLQIVARVLMHNLGGFIPALPSNSVGGALVQPSN